MPGLSVARELQLRAAQLEPLFLGSRRPREEELVTAAGFAHFALPSESLTTFKRRPWRFLWQNWRALRQARAMFLERRPLAVIGLGGYASVPPVIAARQLKIPTVLLEQNVIPGRATRRLARRASAVCTSFAQTTEYLPAGTNVVDTGNPVRQEIAELVASSHVEQRNSLLILGGSQGASAINRSMIHVAEELTAELAGWTIVHQTGINDWRDIEEAYQRLGLEHVTAPFFSDMRDRYAQAGLVVSRAGATSLAELACAGCPTIAIPYPHAADDHQRLNAAHFEAPGAAVVVEQQASVEATAQNLAAALRQLLSDEQQRTSMRKTMHALARPAAGRDVATIINDVITRREAKSR